MAFSKFQIILALILVVSGSINTISVKWMDLIKSVGRDDVERLFVHPFLQANFMFLGEILCLVAFFIIFKILRSRNNSSEDTNELTKGSRNYNALYLLPPALMDITATSLMYFGLSLTNASSFQMLRGSVIVFVAFLSMVVLKRKILVREWIGIALIILALVLVGIADLSQEPHHGETSTDTAALVTTTTTTVKTPDESAEKEKVEDVEQADEPMQGDQPLIAHKILPRNADVIEAGTSEVTNALLGDVLIVVAQLITSCQLVYEEIYITKLDIAPLEMVGFEGIYGFSVLTLILIPLNYIPNIESLKKVNAGGTLEDPIDGLVQVGNNLLILLPILGLVFSIAFYNYSGISLTKEINATTRMVLDSIRILVVWVFALTVSWQTFHWMQVRVFV